jgi:hypothetical protein
LDSWSIIGIMRIHEFRDVINLWPIAELAEDLNEPKFTVEKWRTRNRIPDRAFKGIVDKAKKDKKPVTADLLIALAEKRAGQKAEA